MAVIQSFLLSPLSWFPCADFVLRTNLVLAGNRCTRWPGPAPARLCGCSWHMSLFCLKHLHKWTHAIQSLPPHIISYSHGVLNVHHVIKVLVYSWVVFHLWLAILQVCHLMGYFYIFATVKFFSCGHLCLSLFAYIRLWFFVFCV